LYLFFSYPFPSEDVQYLQQLAEFLLESHERGIKIEALTGNPTWSLSSEHRHALNWIKAFLEFNQSRHEKERIDGVSLDVEPYLAAEWERDREGTARQYLELLQKCREVISNYGQEFRLGVAIPAFYIDELSEFEKAILEWVDYVAVMNYYDTAMALKDKGVPHLKLAEPLGKKVVLGVETQNLVEMGQGSPRNTFYEDGWQEMELLLDELKETFGAYSSFEGYAIHCYYSYRLLQRGRNVLTAPRPEDWPSYKIYAVENTSNITVDGDLSDWPETVKPVRLFEPERVKHGENWWKGPEDLSLVAYPMWTPDALYFGFEVKDNKIVQEKTKEAIWEGDHVELWLDMDLKGDYKEKVNSRDDYQFGLSPGNFSTMPPEVWLWVPPIDPHYKNNVIFAVRQVEGGYVLELKIPAEVLFLWQKRRVGIEPKKAEGIAVLPPQVAKGVFERGMEFGVMIDGSDCDHRRQPQKCLISSSYDREWGDPHTFGMLVLE
jgi:hypothetical protein